MREIKFRAKVIEALETDIDGIEVGDWVYGHYYFDRANMQGIIVTELQKESGGVGSGIIQVHIKVDCKTLGQYTGLHDKNKKEIYDNYVLKVSIFKVCPIVWVSFTDACFELYDVRDGVYVGDLKQIYSVSEIIGNIYENPELLK